MSDADSLKRFDRIVAILIQLQSKRVVKAGELAERFGVSLRTIYRDMRSLEAAGIPLYSEAGVGYGLADGYRLPPIVFTSEEAGTFVAAEKLMKKFMDDTLGKYFESAIYKIKAALKDDQKDWAEAIDSNLMVVTKEQLFDQNVPDVLEILFEAIAEKKQVTLLYHAASSDLPVERNTEPVGLFHENNNWYVFAWCVLRQDYRMFRTDRIRKISRTSIPFSFHHQNLDYYLKQEKVVVRHKVRLLIGVDAARYLRWDRKYFGFIEEKRVGDQIEMIFETDYENNGFERWLMMFADQVDILEPKQLREQVSELIKKIHARHSISKAHVDG